MIFYKNKRPVIRIPIDASLKTSLVAVSCLPSYTTRRKYYKLYLYFRIITNFLFVKHFLDIKDSLIDEAFTDRVVKFALIPENKKLYPVFIWSLVDGRERYYVHFLDANGNKLYFGKITTKKEDYSLLENEKEQLEKFSSAKSFDVPKVIIFNENDKYCSLITTHIGDNFKLYHPENNIFPKKIVSEIQRKPASKSYQEYIKYSWWHTGLKDIKSLTEFSRYINGFDRQTEIYVSKVHGDFGSENIFKRKENGRFYIIDWERSTDIAPYLTDKIAHWLGAHHKQIKKNAEVCKNFTLTFQNEKEIDVAMGLLFLISVNFDLAIMVAKQWKSRNT
jgi:hypothetical protein